jgi:hypothetical protein
VLLDLNKKSVDIESIAKNALEDEKTLSELLEGLLSKKDTIRYNSFKVLEHVSQMKPQVLYPYWDKFVEKLNSDNSFHRYHGVFIIANLTRVDEEKKFEKIFDKYCGLVEDKSFIVAVNVVGNLGKIAKAKPNLQAKITSILLDVGRTSHKHKDLMKSGSIQSFAEYFDETENKEKILEFVSRQLGCESPKTRKMAKQFIEKWGE